MKDDVPPPAPDWESPTEEPRESPPPADLQVGKATGLLAYLLPILRIAPYVAIAFVVALFVRELDRLGGEDGSGSQLTTESFAHHPQVLTHFVSPADPRTRAARPIVQSVSRKYGGRLKVVEVVVEQKPELADKHSVHGTPTLILFVNRKEAGRREGLHSPDELFEWLDGELGVP